MTSKEIDILWAKATAESMGAGKMYTSRRFARMLLEAEREACAKVCEEVCDRYPTDVFPDGTSVIAQSAKMARITSTNCAKEIRARGVE